MYWVIDDSISCQCLLVAQFVDCCTVSQKEDGPASGLSCLQWGIGTGYRSLVRCSVGTHKQWTWAMKWKRRSKHEFLANLWERTSR